MHQEGALLHAHRSASISSNLLQLAVAGEGRDPRESMLDVWNRRSYLGLVRRSRIEKNCPFSASCRA